MRRKTRKHLQENVYGLDKPYSQISAGNRALHRIIPGAFAGPDKN
jgi:hypothetical protein